MNNVHETATPRKSRTRVVKINPAQAKAVARAKTIIALIYNTRDNSNQPKLIQVRANVRFKELETVFAYVWRGPQLPDDDAGRHDLWIAACHIWHLARQCGPIVALRQWVAEWAPWCGPDELQALIDRVDANPRKWTADELAHELGVAVVPFSVRQALGLTTIGSIDVDKAGRELRRSANSTNRSTERRRKLGAVPREQYLAANTANRDQPWLALGISKPTYYRRKKRDAQCGTLCETSANAPKKGNVLVCSDLYHVQPTASAAERVKRDGAPGDHPRGAPEAPPPPHRPIIVRLDHAPDGLIIDQAGIEFKPPPPRDRHPTPRTWMDAAMEGMNRGRA
jgi:hypothetical protein